MTMLRTERSGVRTLGGARVVSLLPRVQTDCGTHPASYSWVPVDLTLGDKQVGREAGLLPLSSAEVKNEWKCTSTSRNGLYRDNLTFTFT